LLLVERAVGMEPFMEPSARKTALTTVWRALPTPALLAQVARRHGSRRKSLLASRFIYVPSARR
jgi:hypothetical protein